MFIEPTIIKTLSGFSGYIWLDTKTVLKKTLGSHSTTSQRFQRFSVFVLRFRGLSEVACHDGTEVSVSGLKIGRQTSLQYNTIQIKFDYTLKSVLRRIASVEATQ